MGVVKNIIDNYIDAICTEVKEDEEFVYEYLTNVKRI